MRINQEQIKYIVSGLILIGFGCGVALAKYSTDTFNRLMALLRDPTVLVGVLCAVIIYFIIYDINEHENPNELD